MTLIASWVNNEDRNNPSIWTLGDTKVSSVDGEETLSLEHGKVFELQIICANSGLPPSPSNRVFQHSIGFAYAGSSLVGLNSYATLNTILSNISTIDKLPPSLEEICETVSKIIRYYSASFCNDKMAFEAMIYGYCVITNRLARYHFSKDGHSSDYSYKDIPDESILLLGDKKREVMEILYASMHGQQGNYARKPLKII